ncbi:hypothetical protein VSR68_05845 [Paraburkholderia phymatum]|uniref:hypothetical protein n=1 Tax=Paraburkholderia phymatum TaxID=148447 RepID=UPI003172B9FF
MPIVAAMNARPTVISTSVVVIDCVNGSAMAQAAAPSDEHTMMMRFALIADATPRSTSFAAIQPATISPAAFIAFYKKAIDYSAPHGNTESFFTTRKEELCLLPYICG